MSTVRDVVLDTMRNDGTLRGYENRATPVIRALEEREHEIVDNLIQFADSKGLRADEARIAIAESGLSVRPVAVASSNGSGDLAAQIDSLRDSLNQMNQALDAIVRRSR